MLELKTLYCTHCKKDTGHSRIVMQTGEKQVEILFLEKVKTPDTVEWVKSEYIMRGCQRCGFISLFLS